MQDFSVCCVFVFIRIKTLTETIRVCLLLIPIHLDIYIYNLLYEFVYAVSKERKTLKTSKWYVRCIQTNKSNDVYYVKCYTLHKWIHTSINETKAFHMTVPHDGTLTYTCPIQLILFVFFFALSHAFALVLQVAQHLARQARILLLWIGTSQIFYITSTLNARSFSHLFILFDPLDTINIINALHYMTLKPTIKMSFCTPRLRIYKNLLFLFSIVSLCCEHVQISVHLSEYEFNNINWFLFSEFYI